MASVFSSPHGSIGIHALIAQRLLLRAISEQITPDDNGIQAPRPLTLRHRPMFGLHELRRKSDRLAEFRVAISGAATAKAPSRYCTTFELHLSGAEYWIIRLRG